jgi:hypothetical protein
VGPRCIVLHRTVGVLGLRVPHPDGHLGQAKRLGGRDPVEAGDELEAIDVVAHDDRHEGALELDRVRDVERADVLRDADPVERDLTPDLGRMVAIWPSCALPTRSPLWERRHKGDHGNSQLMSSRAELHSVAGSVRARRRP